MGFNPFVGGSGGGGAGTDNYNMLTNKPKINHVELKGDKSLVDLGILFGSSLIAEIDSSTYVVTLTLKDQEGNILGEPQSLDLPLESVVVGGRYDNTTKKVVLTLQNGNTIEFSVADLVDGLQSELSSTNKLNPEFINYNSTHRAVSDTEKSTWNGKQDALTFDNTPTNESSNPVKSSGVYVALENKVDKVNGKGLSTNDFTDEDKEQITTNKNGIATLTNAGVKNLLKITGTTASSNGINYTVNQDGTVTVTGTATANSFFMVGSLSGYTGDVILTGCPANGGYQKWRLFKEGTDLSQSDTGNGMTYTLDGTSGIYMIEIYNGQGFTDANPLIFRPMIRPAAIADPTFQPYALPNPVLTPALIEQVDNGAKNLLRNTASSQVVGGVTFTVNADGTIIANGTKTNNDWLYLSVGNKLKADTYVLSSGLAPQSDMSLRLLITTADSLGSAIMSTEGARQDHTKQLTSNYTGLYYAIRISSGTTVNNVVFKPMLCTAADWAVSQEFVPYAPTNRGLYEAKQDNLTFDTTPTTGSTNPVTSGGLFSMFRNAVNRQSIISGTGDLNSAIISGFYKFNGGPSNAPGTGTSSYGMLIVFDYDNYILQICYRFDTSAAYIRASSSTGSSWGAWKEIQTGT